MLGHRQACTRPWASVSTLQETARALNAAAVRIDRCMPVRAARTIHALLVSPSQPLALLGNTAAIHY